MAIQIVVDSRQRGRGLSSIATKTLKRVAFEHGLESVIVPLRPSAKHRFPLIPMEDYLTWQTPDGLPYDGWLRVHFRAGGRIIRVCPLSMRIPGTVAEWAAWTGLEFPGSGRYLVPQALVPVEIDVERDEGVYIEPNIWLVHDAAE